MARFQPSTSNLDPLLHQEERMSHDASMPAITVDEATTPEALEQARIIRELVFAVEQGIPTELVNDGLDESARHVLVTHDGIPAATGRATFSSWNDGGARRHGGGGREGILARIAVLPSYRGQGLGKRVVEYLEVLARRDGIVTLSLKPHHYLETFYAKLGYETVPDSFSTVGTYQLITMTKNLK